MNPSKTWANEVEKMPSSSEVEEAKGPFETNRTPVVQQWNCYVCNFCDKFSIRAARLGDGSEKIIQLYEKNKAKWWKETSKIHTTLIQPLQPILQPYTFSMPGWTLRSLRIFFAPVTQPSWFSWKFVTTVT